MAEKYTMIYFHSKRASFAVTMFLHLAECKNTYIVDVKKIRVTKKLHIKYSIGNVINYSEKNNNLSVYKEMITLQLLILFLNFFSSIKKKNNCYRKVFHIAFM